MTVISERKQKRLIHSFSDQFPVTQKTGIFAQCGRAFDTLSGGKQHIADMMRMVYEQRWQQWKTLELEEESQLAGIWVCHLSSKYYKMTSFYLFFGKLFKRYNHQCDFHSWKVRKNTTQVFRTWSLSPKHLHFRINDLLTGQRQAVVFIVFGRSLIRACPDLSPHLHSPGQLGCLRETEAKKNTQEICALWMSLAHTFTACAHKSLE